MAAVSEMPESFRSTDDRVLLTGLSGFIAKFVALDLLQRGYRVRATVRSAAKGDATRETLRHNGADTARLEIVEADLGQDTGWSEAASGCRFILHMASPFPMAQPRDKFALVPTARDGAVRVMRAAKQAGAERVVMTSSIAAVGYGHSAALTRPLGEADFSNVDSDAISPYAVSKTLAEQAAREALRGSAVEFVTINPVLVLGPLLDDDFAASIEIVRTMMKGRMPAVPDIALGIVDVRDVTAAHVAALLLSPEAPGRRFILAAESLTLREIGEIIADRFPEYRARMPRFTLPDWAVKAAAFVSPQIRQAVPELGSKRTYDTQPARTILGVALRDAAEAVAATGQALIERKLV
ncbi:NAD-dependent epimerase/dehydratase family protein [Consotaella aegiceratis]|uniref:NAD-dependent epimerase/dehydratase family protein n=1 Tax=Consotaella aegiceratis TaxID=3097961 RepID=UPI002F41186E